MSSIASSRRHFRSFLSLGKGKSHRVRDLVSMAAALSGAEIKKKLLHKM
jgi:hypothetical protein